MGIYISLPRYTILLLTEWQNGHLVIVEAPPIARWTVGRLQRDILLYFRSKDSRIRFVR